MKKISAKEAAAFLVSKKIRPSQPRTVIYQYLFNHRTHPTAENIFSYLREDNPSLSLTTVYNTLKLFAENNVAMDITIEGGEMRYDANTDFHVHFKCRICGQVFDIMPEFDPAKILPANNFKIENMRLDCRGLCPECQDGK